MPHSVALKPADAKCYTVFDAQASGYHARWGDAGHDRASGAAKHSVGTRDVAVQAASDDVDLVVPDLVRGGTNSLVKPSGRAS